MGSQDTESNPFGALTAWFGAFGRDLPWRRSRDPWTILVSELMLQQTQVLRVVERLPIFLEQFPNPSVMAAGPAADVILAWTGLGYNRRALNLHRSANTMVQLHGGNVPKDIDALLALPGIGAYTARAVRVFAFEENEAVVDTNVGRVLARMGNSSLKPAAAQTMANSFVPESDPWTWNQAIMELGALVCSKIPDCHRCPVSADCGWFRAGQPDPDPAIGSASVSKKQSRFEGSDRQGRAALVRALGSGSLAADRVASAMGWPEDTTRVARVLQGLLDDGMVVLTGTEYTLPQ